MTTLTTIEAAELRERIARDTELMIVDVRTPAEFESQHIRGAYNVPLSLLSEHTREFADRFRCEVVLVCQSGVRAEEARLRLQEAGLDAASVLAGGTSAYEAAGGEVVRGRQRWAVDRQMRLVAGSLVLGGFLGARLVARPIGWLSAAVGAGLAFSAVRNACPMVSVLTRMPWNRTTVDPTLASTVRNIPVATGTVTLS